MATAIQAPRTTQAECQALHVRIGTRKEFRIMSVSYDFDKPLKITGCRLCQMEDGFHSSGCPKEYT